MSESRISRKKKTVADGLFKAETHEFLAVMLKEKGFAGVEIRITPARTFVIIKTTRTRDVLGPEGRNLREIASLVRKRFNLSNEQIELLTERLENRGLSAMAQAESLRFKLIRGLPARRACYSVVRTIMESGATGCEVSVSGKLRAQRAKVMKFRDGYMITKGYPASLYIIQAVRTISMKQGVLGLKVKIMLPHDPRGVEGPRTPIPDSVIISMPAVNAYENVKSDVENYFTDRDVPTTVV